MNFGIERVACGHPRHEGHYIDDDGFHVCADCCAAEHREAQNREIIRRNHLGVAGGQGRSGDDVSRDVAAAITVPIQILTIVALLAGAAIAATVFLSQ